jgi:hypothetical protein
MNPIDRTLLDLAQSRCLHDVLDLLDLRCHSLSSVSPAECA